MRKALSELLKLKSCFHRLSFFWREDCNFIVLKGLNQERLINRHWYSQKPILHYFHVNKIDCGTKTRPFKTNSTSSQQIKPSYKIKAFNNPRIFADLMKRWSGVSEFSLIPNNCKMSSASQVPTSFSVHDKQFLLEPNRPPFPSGKSTKLLPFSAFVCFHNGRGLSAPSRDRWGHLYTASTR